MKKFIKVMLILTLVLAVSGIGLATAGAALGATTESVDFLRAVKGHLWEGFHWFQDDWEDDWEDEWEDGREELSAAAKTSLEADSEDDCRVYELENVREMEFSLRYDELELEPYSGDKVRLEIYGDTERDVRVETEGDGFEMESSRKIEPGRVIKVFYPENSVFRKVDIETEEGSVNMGALETDELDVSVGAGAFYGEGIRVREASLEVGVGELQMEALDAEALDGECGMGEMSVTLKGSQADWNAQLECGVGEIVLGDESFTALASEKRISNPGAAKYMELECGIGTVTVDFTE